MTGSATPRPRIGHLDALAVTLMLACCVLWGLQQVVVKLTLPALPAFLQAAVRSAIGAVLVFAWSRQRGIALFARDGSLLPGVVAGLFFGVEFLCIYAALTMTDASRVSVFLYAAPFVVALGLPRFVPSERLTWLQGLGMACAFAALVYAFQEAFTSPVRTLWIGDALSIVAALLWGFTTLVIRTTRLAAIAPEKTLFYQLGISAVLLYATSAVRGEGWPTTGAIAGLPAWAWLSIAFQSAIVAFASYLTWFWLLRHYPATRLSAFSFLTPVFGLLFAALALGEAISARLVTAMVFIAIGIVLVNVKRRAVAS